MPHHICRLDGCLKGDLCPRAREMLDMATSKEATILIVATYSVAALTHGARVIRIAVRRK